MTKAILELTKEVYVLRTPDGQYMNIDNAAGGYPYSTTIDKAYHFVTFMQAAEYVLHFPLNTIQRLTIAYAVESI